LDGGGKIQMTVPRLAVAAAEAPPAPSTAIAWDVGLGSLVVLVGGITASVGRSRRRIP
jgi:hypothetical protein